MNDFTKEELECTKIGISCRWSKGLGIVPEKILNEWEALENKIQNMIDNYCEHASLEGTDMRKCFKCGTMFV